MEKIEIQGVLREQSGKGVARKLRAQGRIPAVLYSQGQSTLLSLNPKDIQRVLHSSSGENTLITLRLDTGSEAAERIAILREFQNDPINGDILHVDLFEISMTEKIHVRIPVEIIGEVPLGVKEGGVLQHHLREIEVRCLPAQIPDHIRVDATQLNIGDIIHIRDLPAEEGIEILDEEDQSIVSVAAPITDAKFEELLSAGKEVAEPEVVARGKEEAEKGEEKPEKGAPEAKGKPAKEEPKKEAKK